MRTSMLVERLMCIVCGHLVRTSLGLEASVCYLAVACAYGSQLSRTSVSRHGSGKAAWTLRASCKLDGLLLYWEAWYSEWITYLHPRSDGHILSKLTIHLTVSRANIGHLGTGRWCCNRVRSAGYVNSVSSGRKIAFLAVCAIGVQDLFTSAMSALPIQVTWSKCFCVCVCTQCGYRQLNLRLSALPLGVAHVGIDGGGPQGCASPGSRQNWGKNFAWYEEQLLRHYSVWLKMYNLSLD